MADDPNEPTEETDESSDETSDDTTPPPTPEPDKGPEIPAALKSVIDRERRLTRDATKRAKNAEAELAKHREATMTENERAIKAARDAALKEGVEKGNERLLRAEVIAAAAGKVVDPDDAYVLLLANGALSDVAVGEDGDVDTRAIKTALDDLVKAKPHLAARRGPAPFGSRSPASAAESPASQFDAWIREQARK